MSEKLTVADVLRGIPNVQECAAAKLQDAARAAEIALHQKVLLSISKGECDDPAGCAAAALQTWAIKFDRGMGGFSIESEREKPQEPKTQEPIYRPCGGCGAEKPSERCLGCFHDFG